MHSNKPTEVDSMNRLRVQAEDKARAYRDLLVRMTSATSISHFHALLCEAKELLAADGVPACTFPACPAGSCCANPSNARGVLGAVPLAGGWGELREGKDYERTTIQHPSTRPSSGYTREGFLRLLHERLAAAHLAGRDGEGFPASSLRLLEHYFDQLAAGVQVTANFKCSDCGWIGAVDPKAPRCPNCTPGVKACGSHQCIAAQRDGVLCADGECDRENGVRPDGVRVNASASAWWALVMGAAASIEDAAHCLRDPDAKKQADGAAKHYREAAQKLIAADGVQGTPALAGLADYLRLMAHSQSAPETLRRWADEVDRITRGVDVPAPRLTAAQQQCLQEILTSTYDAGYHDHLRGRAHRRDFGKVQLPHMASILADADRLAAADAGAAGVAMPPAWKPGKPGCSACEGRGWVWEVIHNGMTSTQKACACTDGVAIPREGQPDRCQSCGISYGYHLASCVALTAGVRLPGEGQQ